MAVCNDKACEAILCGDCKDLIPSMCGDRVPNIVEGSCSAIRFEGVDDVSINQGECIDLTEGVHAYDGNGNEIEYTVTPSEIPCCGVGEYEVKYSAVGIGNKMLPSFCTNAFMLMLSDCGMDTKSVLRKIIVNAIVSPIISGIDTVCIDTDTLFNPMSGVSVVDGNGNTLEVDHNGIYDQVASGSIASFESVGGNIKSLIAHIEPVQSGTGTPSPDNVRPISGHDSVVVTRTGINIWDEEWEVGGISSTGANTNRTDTIRSINYIPVKPSTRYFYKSSHTIGIRYYDADKVFISSESANNNARETPSNCHYVRFLCLDTTTYNHDISINYPSTDTEYHAYAGQTYTTDLGRTVYGGSLDVVSGVLTVDRAYVDMGTLNWTSQSTSDQKSYYSDVIDDIKKPSSATALSGAICSAYSEKVSNNFIARGNGVFCISQSGRINVNDNAYSDATSFKTAMNGVQLVYELATPQTYQLTPQQVTALLGDNNIWASTGDVDVEYPIEMPDGAFTFPTDGAFEITYHAEDECGNETTETRLIVVGSENSVCKARVCCASTEEC